MSDSEFEEAAPQVKSYFKRVWILAGSVGALATYGAFVVTLGLYQDWAGPVVEPIVNERAHWLWLMPCALAVFGMIALIENFYCNKINSHFGRLLNRYLSTQYQWNARAVALFGSLLAIFLSVLLSIALINAGNVIDKNGMQVSSGITLSRYPFSEVVKIGSYDAFVAPVGRREVFNIAISLRDGNRLTFIADDRRSPAMLEEIIAYVSQASGIEIERSGMRPDN